MGLLDALFSGDTFGGQGGDLLKLIRDSQAQNAVQQNAPGFPQAPQGDSFASRFNALPNAPPIFSPSGRSFDNAQFDPSTYAPNQAQPIGIGSYQMPRMGSADQFTPIPGAPPSAAPAINANAQAPQAQQSAPQQEPQLPPALGGQPQGVGLGDRLAASAANFTNAGGPLQALFGGISGLANGQRTDALGMQQQNLKAEYDALKQTLVQSGMAEPEARSKAMLAVMNKDAGKTILSEALTSKQKYGITNEDPLSGKQYGFINERDQTVNGKPIGQAGAPGGPPSGMQGITDKITEMRSAGASREQMLAVIPSGYRDDVEALVKGKAVPANMGRAQVRGTLNILAHAVDKDYDEQLIPARIQMRKDFAGEGKNGQAIGALNTVQHHAGQVSDAIEEFEKAGGGGNWPLINGAKLALANNTSYDPTLRDSATKLNNKLNAMEHEVAGAYNAGHLSDHDLKTWNEIKASSLPSDQLRRKLADFDELLDGKRDSLNHIYQTMFHEDAPTIDKKANQETSAKIHSRLPNRSEGQATLPSGWSVKVR